MRRNDGKFGRRQVGEETCDDMTLQSVHDADRSAD